MRCFLAVPVEPAWQLTLGSARDLITRAEPSWRRQKWVRPDRMHVTLQFFAELPPSDVMRLCEAYAHAAARLAPFDLLFSRIEATPSFRRCRLIWARFSDTDGAFAEAVQTFRSVAGEAHSGASEKRPSPHVTLCRARQPMPLSEGSLDAVTSMVSAQGRSLSVPCATFYESRLTPSGPVYRPLQTWPLGG